MRKKNKKKNEKKIFFPVIFIQIYVQNKLIFLEVKLKILHFDLWGELDLDFENFRSRQTIRGPNNSFEQKIAGVTPKLTEI